MRLAIVDSAPTPDTFAEDDEVVEIVEVEPPDGTPVEAGPAVDEAASGEIPYVLAVEGSPTGDGRIFEVGALTFADFPFPFMATDQTGEGHDGARLIGHFVRGQMEGNEAIAYSTMIDSDDAEVQNLQKLVRDGSLPGISVDLDDVAGNLVIKAMTEADDEDGNYVIEFGGDTELQTITKGRIRAATAVPIQAFVEAKQSPEEIVAALLTGKTSVEFAPRPIVASGSYPITAPVAPPSSWFSDPVLTGPVPLTVTDDGRLFGHVALWKSCHRGFDSCTPPPRAPGGDYSHFHTGTVVAEDGARVSVGNITVDSGHADLTEGAFGAKEHYDNSGWCGADVVCGEDEFGIWMAGALRSDITPDKIRSLMACDVSGDWRAIDGKLRLIGLASIPVPGFVKTQVASGALVALVASVPICDTSTPDLEQRRIADRIALSIGRHRDQIMAERDRIAFGLGRHSSQRLAALSVRVHGDV
jgi:hypothetical protein